MLADYKFIPCNSAERSESPELQLLGSNNPGGRVSGFFLGFRASLNVKFSARVTYYSKS